MYWNMDNLYVSVMLQKWLYMFLYGFTWIALYVLKIYLKLLKISVKILMTIVILETFLKSNWNILRNWIYHFIKNVKKLLETFCNLNDKEKDVVHVKTLKQALNHVLILEKFPKARKYNQKTWLKKLTEISTKFCKNSWNNFAKKSKLISNVVFSKTLENVIKQSHITLIATHRRRNYVVS